jgi:DNA-directed RNA polymerase specialized sigma24 family protein
MPTPLFFLNDDLKLLDALRNGNDQALAELFHKNRRSITSLVLKNHGSEDDAEDILQEALVVLWEKIQSGSF